MGAEQNACFGKETYRLNSTIEGDPGHRVIDNNTIEVKGKKGFEKYTRAKTRENTLQNKDPR